jgi:starch synthase
MENSNKKTVLFAASEAFPFAKSGGLADVMHSLPKALSRDYHTSVIIPLYQFIDKEKYGISSLGENTHVIMGENDYFIELYGCQYEGVDYYFVYSPSLSDRPFMYGPPEKGYEDNAHRFALFCQAIVQLLKQKRFDLLHLNDWQSAMCALFVKEESSIDTKVVYTIHNLAYQGIFDKETFNELGLHHDYFTSDGLEFYGDVNFMKSGIAYADGITTVSPTYRGEILSPEFGNGLDGFLQFHSSKLKGILNGLDTDHFSPQNDILLEKRYGPKTLKDKHTNKKLYFRSIGLNDPNKPLFIFIGRFTWQKGIDILTDALNEMAQMPINISILGEGDLKYRQELAKVALEHKNISLFFGYDESVSHKMYAAADFLLMPSLFEPCGLNQMIAMKYGAIPIVHAVGGLKDTVSPLEVFDTRTNIGYGIISKKKSAKALVASVEKAVNLFSDKKKLNKIIVHNMKVDFSSKKSAERYSEFYTELLQNSP